MYRAPITSGKPGYETPTGTFYVSYRVYNEVMDSATLGVPHDDPDGYYMPNVLYTQYLSVGGGIAMHSNYWSPDSAFGNYNVSHGCVSMRTDDARFFWEFASVGTPVRIHRGNAAPAPSPLDDRVDQSSPATSEHVQVDQPTSAVSTLDEQVQADQPTPATSTFDEQAQVEQSTGNADDAILVLVQLSSILFGHSLCLVEHLNLFGQTWLAFGQSTGDSSADLGRLSSILLDRSLSLAEHLNRFGQTWFDLVTG